MSRGKSPPCGWTWRWIRYWCRRAPSSRRASGASAATDPARAAARSRARRASRRCRGYRQARPRSTGRRCPCRAGPAPTCCRCARRRDRGAAHGRDRRPPRRPRPFAGPTGRRREAAGHTVRWASRLARSRRSVDCGPCDGHRTSPPRGGRRCSLEIVARETGCRPTPARATAVRVERAARSGARWRSAWTRSRRRWPSLSTCGPSRPDKVLFLAARAESLVGSPLASAADLVTVPCPGARVARRGGTGCVGTAGVAAAVRRVACSRCSRRSSRPTAWTAGMPGRLARTGIADARSSSGLELGR